MTRSLAAAFLAGIYSQQLTEVGLTAVDNDANVGPVIDEALLRLGTAYDDLATTEVTGDTITGYRVLLRYFGLSRILDAVQHRVNISGGNPSASKSAGDYPKELRARLADLAKEAANYGLTVGPSWQAPTSVGLDYLEPWPTL